jgi:hypothetical protein
MKLLNDFITLHLDLINLKFNKKKARTCLNIKCTKRASFNYKKYKDINIRKHIYCKSHKLYNMIDITHFLCIGCNNTRPAFNYKNEKKALYCGKCASPNMIDIRSKMCIKCNNSHASFNYKNKKKVLYCGKCALLDMINIKSKMCITCNSTVPIFNYKNEKIALYCVKCSSPGMRDIKNKMCIKCNNSQSNFNYKNEKKTLYCGKCALPDMIDLTHKKCKTDLCDIRVNKRFKGYCLRCFIYNFPNDKLVRDYGTRKSKVSEFIQENYKDLNITYNKTIEGGCSKNRPYIFIDCLTHSVIIEVDEHQHKGNSKSYTPECENQRVNNLFTDLADRPIIFIRFNPDSYTNHKNIIIKSCFEYTEDKGLPKALKTLQTRLKKLKEVIDNNLSKVPNDNIKTIKLYYDEY